MSEPAETVSDRFAEEIQAALARVVHRGYDAPPGDWIQNPRPVHRPHSVN
jgi:hypothetical protein